VEEIGKTKIANTLSPFGGGAGGGWITETGDLFN